MEHTCNLDTPQQLPSNDLNDVLDDPSFYSRLKQRKNPIHSFLAKHVSQLFDIALTKSTTQSPSRVSAAIEAIKSKSNIFLRAAKKSQPVIRTLSTFPLNSSEFSEELFTRFFNVMNSLCSSTCYNFVLELEKDSFENLLSRIDSYAVYNLLLDLTQSAWPSLCDYLQSQNAVSSIFAAFTKTPKYERRIISLLTNALKSANTSSTLYTDCMKTEYLFKLFQLMLGQDNQTASLAGEALFYLVDYLSYLEDEDAKEEPYKSTIKQLEYQADALLQLVTNSQPFTEKKFMAVKLIDMMSLFIQAYKVKLYQTCGWLLGEIPRNPSNSFLQRAFLLCFNRLAKDVPRFVQFVKESQIQNQIIEVIEGRVNKYYPYGGTMLKAAEIINQKSSDIETFPEWDSFIMNTYTETLAMAMEPFGGDCYAGLDYVEEEEEEIEEEEEEDVDQN